MKPSQHPKTIEDAGRTLESSAKTVIRSTKPERTDAAVFAAKFGNSGKTSSGALVGIGRAMNTNGTVMTTVSKSGKKTAGGTSAISKRMEVSRYGNEQII
jgi:hypothetical protein